MASLSWRQCKRRRRHARTQPVPLPRPACARQGTLFVLVKDVPPRDQLLEALARRGAARDDEQIEQLAEEVQVGSSRGGKVVPMSQASWQRQVQCRRASLTLGSCMLASPAGLGGRRGPSRGLASGSGQVAAGVDAAGPDGQPAAEGAGRPGAAEGTAAGSHLKLG